MRVKLKPFAVERRVLIKFLPQRTPAEVHALAVAAVAVALRPVADDVARLLEGRMTFPREFYGDAR